MDESKNFFKNHTDKRVSEIHERTKKFKAERLKEKIRKNSKTHRKRKEEKFRGRKKIWKELSNGSTKEKGMDSL